MTYAVGDKVWADYGRYSRIEIREGVIAKVSPSNGIVTVDFGKHGTDRFMSHGRRYGSDTYSAVYLKTDLGQLEKLREANNKRERQDAAILAIRKLAEVSIGDKAALLEALKFATEKANAL